LLQVDACADASLWETAARFDFTPLDQIPAKTITSARLTWDEASDDASGRCVESVWLVTADWPQSILPGPLPGTAYPIEFFTGVGEKPHVDVTAPVQRAVLHIPSVLGTSPDARFGFMLRSAIDSIDEVQPDNPDCFAYVSNITLHLTYVVPEQD
jgi:hypothetical protein